MYHFRVTVTVAGFEPVSRLYRTAAKAIKNAAKVVDHAARPMITIEPVLITEPGA